MKDIKFVKTVVDGVEVKVPIEKIMEKSKRYMTRPEIVVKGEVRNLPKHVSCFDAYFFVGGQDITNVHIKRDSDGNFDSEVVSFGKNELHFQAKAVEGLIEISDKVNKSNCIKSAEKVMRQTSNSLRMARFAHDNIRAFKNVTKKIDVVEMTIPGVIIGLNSREVDIREGNYLIHDIETGELTIRRSFNREIYIEIPKEKVEKKQREGREADLLSR